MQSPGWNELHSLLIKSDKVMSCRGNQPIVFKQRVCSLCLWTRHIESMCIIYIFFYMMAVRVASDNWYFHVLHVFEPMMKVSKLTGFNGFKPYLLYLISKFDYNFFSNFIESFLPCPSQSWTSTTRYSSVVLSSLGSPPRLKSSFSHSGTIHSTLHNID